MSIQTILGANGVIGRELSRHLSAYTDRIRQVGRTPRRVHATDDLVSADLLMRRQRPAPWRAARSLTWSLA